MSAYKFAAGLAAVAMSAAAMTALAGSNPEVKAEVVPMVRADLAPDAADLAPVAAKGDRLAVRVIKPEKPAAAASACPQEPWPFGCQWRPKTRKVLRGSRPS
jgi:hypothetical protein